MTTALIVEQSRNHPAQRATPILRAGGSNRNPTDQKIDPSVPSNPPDISKPKPKPRAKPKPGDDKADGIGRRPNEQ
jgi:hypothetical protein